MVGGCGYGAEPAKREQFRAETNAAAEQIEKQGMREVAKRYSLGPTRVQFQNKNPRAWREFTEQLAEHSTLGSALTMRGVQGRRPFALGAGGGDEAHRGPDAHCDGRRGRPVPRARNFLKRSIATAALAVLPSAGHTINLEDPEEFNRALFNFLAAVDMGTWRRRDPRSTSGGILGMARK